MWRLTGFLLVAAVAQGGDCIAVDGPRILGRHLAQADAALSSLPQTQEFGFTPAPGRKRTVDPGEVARWARQSGQDLRTQEPLCFVRRAEPLTTEKVLKAIQRALGPTAEVQVLEFSRFPVPPGELIFAPGAAPVAPASAQSGQSEGVRLFRGALHYGDRLTVPVWARAKVQIAQAVVIATADLPVGKSIPSSAVRAEIHRGPLLGGEMARDLAVVVGRVPKRTVRAGEYIATTNLAEGEVIERGQQVAVEVHSGATRIKFSAEAQSGGKLGDRIIMRNPTSGKRFQARVTAPGKAVLEVAQAAPIAIAERNKK